MLLAIRKGSQPQVQINFVMLHLWVWFKAEHRLKRIGYPTLLEKGNPGRFLWLGLSFDVLFTSSSTNNPTSRLCLQLQLQVSKSSNWSSPIPVFKLLSDLVHRRLPWLLSGASFASAAPVVVVVVAAAAAAVAVGVAARGITQVHDLGSLKQIQILTF